MKQNKTKWLRLYIIAIVLHWLTLQLGDLVDWQVDSIRWPVHVYQNHAKQTIEVL